MDKKTVVAVTLAAVLFPVNLFAGDGLLFEMAGPRDGALPDFFISAGQLSKTTRQKIYVTPEAYASIAALVANTGTHTAKINQQVFSITEFRDSVRKPATYIADKAVGDIMRGIILMYRAQGQSLPEIVPEIAASLP